MSFLKHIKNIYVLLCIALIPACEMAIDLDDPYPGNRLVINGMINPDSAVRVSITQSRSVLDEDIWHYYYGDQYNYDPEKEPYYKPVRGAIVRLYEDDVLVATLNEDTTDAYVSNYYPKTGSEYRLEVTKEGFPTAIANTTIPEINAEILTLDFEVLSKERSDYPGEIESSYYELLCYLNFRDKDGEDFYEIQFGEEWYDIIFSYGNEKTYEIQGPPTVSYFSQLESEDIVYTPFVDTDKYIHRVFNDQLFQQKSKTLHFETETDDAIPRQMEFQFGVILRPNLHIQLRNLSHDYYSYFSSLALQIRSAKNPFSEPVQVYSNVENGYGIFAGYNAQVKKFPIPWQDW